MVTSATNFSRNGVSDWLIQRFTAVVLALYTLFLVSILVQNPEMDYATWSGIFAQTWVRIFTLIALLSIAGHAWVGLWTVSTDYIKGAGARFLFQVFFGVVTFTYVVWGIQILWGL